VPGDPTGALPRKRERKGEQRCRRYFRWIRYLLQDRSLLRTRFDNPIITIADRRLGSMLMTLCGNRFVTQVYIGGEGIDSCCLTVML
jgi:hypothetical protein